MTELQSFAKSRNWDHAGTHPTPHTLHASFLESEGREDGSTLQSFSSNAAKLIGSVRQDYAITLSHGQLPELTQDICAAHAARGTWQPPRQNAPHVKKNEKVAAVFLMQLYTFRNHKSWTTFFQNCVETGGSSTSVIRVSRWGGAAPPRWQIMQIL